MILIILDQDNQIYMNKLCGELFIFKIIKSVSSRSKIIIIHRESMKKYNFEFIVKNRFNELDIDFIPVNFNYCNRTSFEVNNENLACRITKFIFQNYANIDRLMIINTHILYDDSIMYDYNILSDENIIYYSEFNLKTFASYYIGNISDYLENITKISDIYDFKRYLKFSVSKHKDFNVIENQQNINFFELDNVSDKLKINFVIEDVLFDKTWKPIAKNVKKVNKLFAEGHYIILTTYFRNKFSYFDDVYLEDNTSGDIVNLLILNSINYNEIHFGMPKYDITFNQYNINQNISGNYLKEKKYISNNINDCNLPHEYLLKSNKVFFGVSFKNLLDNNMINSNILRGCIEMIEISTTRTLAKYIDIKTKNIKSIFRDYYDEIINESLKRNNNTEIWIQNKFEALLKEHMENIKFTTCNLDNISLKDIIYYNFKIKVQVRKPERFINKVLSISDSVASYSRLLYHILIHENGDKLLKEFIILISPVKRSSVKFITSLMFLKTCSYSNCHYEIAMNLISSF